MADRPAINIQEATEEHFARIHRAALVLSGNPWDADDLAQETFMVFASQADRFEGRSSLYTWLYGILLNLDRRERRRYSMRRNKLRILWEDEPEQQQTAPAAETAIEVAEWKNSLWAYVSKLPDGQRQALVLRFSESMKYDEIAEVLDCPLGTVKSRIFHGLDGLRRLMEKDGESLRSIPLFPNQDQVNAV
ncbi:MAG: RNA polymerase sigma factor [bacterium]|nr:RNA polymerase sigma factor [bacterium]